jgi:hypothetical protein
MKGREGGREEGRKEGEKEKEREREKPVQWFTLVIPAIWEAEIGMITFGGQPREKVSQIPSQQVSWAQWYTPEIPDIPEA